MPNPNGAPPSKGDTLDYDVVIVGAGPAGLATAWALHHHPASRHLSLCILEKSARLGGHIISGALMDEAALTRLIPTWREQNAPLHQPLTQEAFYWWHTRQSIPLPLPTEDRSQTWLISLGALCHWMGERLEQAGVDILPGFPAVELLWEGEQLTGVRTGDLGRDHQGHPKPTFQPGTTIRAKITVLAEGCRGYLSQQAIRHLSLDRNRPPQTYALGFKELWTTPHSQPGTVWHTVGYPLPHAVYGGGFVYHMAPNQIALGWILGLDYKDGTLDPYHMFQRWKGHPQLAALLEGGRPIAYGARTLVEGGWQSLPEVVFEGGMLVGDAAGFLNSARLQGIGPALDSGRLAATGIRSAFETGQFSRAGLEPYASALAHAPLMTELHAARNTRPGFRAGRWPGLVNAFWERHTRGRSPWTWQWRTQDRACLRPLKRPRPCADTQPEAFRAPTASRPDAALALSRLSHTEDQPCHIQLQDETYPIKAGWTHYDNPETRYCPGRVFERQRTITGKRLYIMHAVHCLHCKSCDIKDPGDNIRWTPPEGGSGPDYSAM